VIRYILREIHPSVLLNTGFQSRKVVSTVILLFVKEFWLLITQRTMTEQSNKKGEKVISERHLTPPKEVKSLDITSKVVTEKDATLKSLEQVLQGSIKCIICEKIILNEWRIHYKNLFKPTDLCQHSSSQRKKANRYSKLEHELKFREEKGAVPSKAFRNTGILKPANLHGKERKETTRDPQIISLQLIKQRPNKFDAFKPKARNWTDEDRLKLWIPLNENSSFYEQYYTPFDVLEQFLKELFEIIDPKSLIGSENIVDPTAGDGRFGKVLFEKYKINTINIDIDKRILKQNIPGSLATNCLDYRNVDSKGLKANFITNPPFGTNKYSRPMARQIRHKIFRETENFAALMTTPKDFEYLKTRSPYRKNITKLGEYEFSLPQKYEYQKEKIKTIKVIGYIYKPSKPINFTLNKDECPVHIKCRIDPSTFLHTNPYGKSYPEIKIMIIRAHSLLKCAHKLLICLSKARENLIKIKNSCIWCKNTKRDFSSSGLFYRKTTEDRKEIIPPHLKDCDHEIYYTQEHRTFKSFKGKPFKHAIIPSTDPNDHYHFHIYREIKTGTIIDPNDLKRLSKPEEPNELPCWMCKYVKENPKQNIHNKVPTDFYEVKNPKKSSYQEMEIFKNAIHKLFIYKEHKNFSFKNNAIYNHSSPIVATTPSFPSHFHYHKFYEKETEVNLPCQNKEVSKNDPRFKKVNITINSAIARLSEKYMEKGDFEGMMTLINPLQDVKNWRPTQTQLGRIDQALQRHKLRHFKDELQRLECHERILTSDWLIDLKFVDGETCIACREKHRCFDFKDYPKQNLCLSCGVSVTASTEYYESIGINRKEFSDFFTEIMIKPQKLDRKSEALTYILNERKLGESLHYFRTRFATRFAEQLEPVIFSILLGLTYDQGIDSIKKSIEAVKNKDIDDDADINPTDQEDGLVSVWELIFKSGSSPSNVETLLAISLATFRDYFYTIWGPFGTGKSYNIRQFATNKDLIVCASFALKLEYTIKMCQEREIECPFSSENPPARKEVSQFLKMHSGKNLPFIKTFQVAAMIPPGVSYDTVWVDECYMQSMLYAFWYQMFNFLSSPNRKKSIVMVGDHLQVNAPDFQNVSKQGNLITFKQFREFLTKDHSYLLNVTFRCGLDTIFYMIKNYNYPKEMRSCNPNTNTFKIHDHYKWRSNQTKERITVKLSSGAKVTKKGTPIIGEHAMTYHQKDKDHFHFAQINTVAEYQGNEKHVADLYIRDKYKFISSGHEVVSLTRHIDTLHVVFEGKQNTFHFLNERPTAQQLAELFVDKSTVPKWKGFINLRKNKSVDFVIKMNIQKEYIRQEITYYWCKECNKETDDVYIEEEGICCNKCDQIVQDLKFKPEKEISPNLSCINPKCKNHDDDIEDDFQILCKDCKTIYYLKFMDAPDETESFYCKTCQGYDFKHKIDCKFMPKPSIKPRRIISAPKTEEIKTQKFECPEHKERSTRERPGKCQIDIRDICTGYLPYKGGSCPKCGKHWSTNKIKNHEKGLNNLYKCEESIWSKCDKELTIIGQTPKDFDQIDFNRQKEMKPKIQKGYITIISPCCSQWNVHKTEKVPLDKEPKVIKHINSCTNRFCKMHTNYRIIE